MRICRAADTHKSFVKMLFFIFHLISITMWLLLLLLSSCLTSAAASWPGLMPEMGIDHSSFAKSKCAEYIIGSNIVENDLVVIWRRPKSKVIGHSLIQRIMNVTNVHIAGEDKPSQVWYKRSGDVPPPTLVQTQMAQGDDESFPHKLSKGNVFIIETSISECDRSIASISKSIVYNSRAHFILLVSIERNNDTTTTTMKTTVVDENGDDDATTHSCENEIKWKNHSHNDEEWCNTAPINTFNNVTNPAGVDRKINDEKMIHGTLKHVFRSLWSRHIFNAVIMLCETIDMETETKTMAFTSSSSKLADGAGVVVCAYYTWFPFDECSKCGQSIEHFVKIDECVYDKNRNHLQFHYSAENKWYFGVSDDDEQGQINNRRRLNESGPNGRRSGNHVPNENKIVVGNVPHSYTYTFQMDKNFNNNTSLFNLSSDGSNMGTTNGGGGSFQMEITNWSNVDGDVDGIEPFNLCILNALCPSVRLFVINETQSTNRERVRNQELAKNYFKYDVREFGTIEFRKNRIVEHLTTGHGMPATNTNNMTDFDANTPTRLPSIMMKDQQQRQRRRRRLQQCQRTISNRHRPHFYEKIPSDLLGCVYDALVIVWPPFVTPATAAFYGLEHKLLLDVARHMNYRMNETYKQFGNAMDGRDEGGGNGDGDAGTEAGEGVGGEEKTTYSYGILVNSTASMAFGNIYPIANMHNKFDASIGYLYDHVNWAVPLARTAPAWLNLFNCFRYKFIYYSSHGKRICARHGELSFYYFSLISFAYISIPECRQMRHECLRVRNCARALARYELNINERPGRSKRIFGMKFYHRFRSMRTQFIIHRFSMKSRQLGSAKTAHK